MSDANSSQPGVPSVPGPDRRESQRENCERYAMVFPLNDATPERFQRACITTRSDNGVGITCVHEIAVGTKFILRYNEGRPEPKLYEVVQSRWVGGACLIGARLIRELTPAHSAAPPSAA